MKNLLNAALYGDIASMKQLVEEGADFTERDALGMGVAHFAAMGGRYSNLRWLLVEGRASISERGHSARHTVWNLMGIRDGSDGELSSLLKVMVMLQDAPTSSAHKASNIGRSCRRTWISKGRQSLLAAPSLKCCIPSSPRTLRPPRRTYGRTDCVYEHRAKEVSLISYIIGCCLLQRSVD
jgi:hypothetical protein